MLPRGLSEVGNGLVDNCPDIARNDVLRQLSRLVLSEEDRECIAWHVVAAAGKAAIHEARAAKETGGTPAFVSRIASDRARLMVIEVMSKLHRPPAEAMPEKEYDNTARSRLFKELRIQFVSPVDSVAVKVAGDDQPRSDTK